MSLNCTEIEEIVNYLPKNCFIKKIFQIDKFTIIINIFDNKNEYFILGSVKDKYNRICLIPENEYIKKNILRFSQILNSNINNYKIIKIYQYYYSRVVVIEVQSQKIIKKLIFRLWGNGGNILLLDDNNKIIECLRRMPKRGEWPNEIFRFPEKKEEKEKSIFKIRKEFFNDNFNDNIYFFYNELINKDDINKKKKNIEDIFNKEIKLLEEKLKNINSNINYDKEKLYIKYGELLKANLYKIKKGIIDIEVEDYEENNKVKIPLDRRLTPSENIEKYFNMYRKLKNSRTIFEKNKKSIEDKLYELRNNINILKNINNINQISEIEKKNKNILKLNVDKKIKGKKLPGKYFILFGGYNTFVSRNAKESHELLKTIAKGNDYWFHIREYPGSHVIVQKNKDNEIGNKTKIEAANLAVFFSKCKNPKYVDVYFTQVKYLHKLKGSPLGLVFPIKEKNIKIKFNKKLVEEIFNR